MRKPVLFLLIFFLGEKLSGQNSIGLPDIFNYTKQNYGAGSQNWDIAQASNGIIYFANNEGLLVFDGSYWNLHRLPNKTIVRSIELKGEKIYVGAQNEIGYFSPNKKGELVYTSLLPLLPEKERSFADVWNIISYGNDLFFHTNNKIIRLRESKVIIYKDFDWQFLGLSNGRLLAQNHNYKILEFKNNSWAGGISQSVLPKEFLVTSFLPYNKDTALITTFKKGIYFLAGNTLSKFQTPTINFVAEKNIYKSIPIGDNQILLATSLGGCFIIDKKGNLVQSFSLAEGLQNNNVRYPFLDKNRNLWLGLDNGIDFLAYDNAIKHIYTDRQNEGGGYSALIHKNALYLGTSNGLYSSSLDNSKNLSLAKGSFKLISKSEGQVWSLSEVNGELLMGHHEGSFVIRDNTATAIDKSTGFWNFFPYQNKTSPLMIAGTYHGINFYNYEKGTFTSHSNNAVFESARIVAIDKDDIWVAHPYKGIFKVNLTNDQPTYKLYAGKGITSVSHYYIYKIRNKIVAPTENGFFEYNIAKDKFEQSPQLEKIFGSIRVNYMREDAAGNIWFTSEKNLGVVDFSGAEPRIIYIPELNGKMVSGFDFVYPVDLNNVLVGGEKGFYNINYEQYRNNKNKFEVLIRTVKPINEPNGLVFGGYYGADGKRNYTSHTVPELGYKWNSLHFEFSALLYGQQANVEYNYNLEGFDNWSGWTKKTEKDYTNLLPGTYTFMVKARNNLGSESQAAKFTFTILPPWYRSSFAYFLYTLVVAAVMFLLYKRQKLKFIKQRLKYEEEQKQLQYLHQLEIDRSEKKIVKLKNEKLESEINHKNKELAAATMHLVQKGELMGKIREELMRLLKDIGNENSIKDFKKVIKMMTEDDKFEEDWEQFAFHFDRVHGDFLMSLKTKFPNLTNSELKLCAYLRMNLSTKEMAQLMNISVRGVEVSRYRLRKKLQIPSEVNLFDYLIDCIKEEKLAEEI